MQYLFLVYSEDTLTAGDGAAFVEACQANASALRESGYLLIAVPLQTGVPSITLRVQSGELSLSDGPSSGMEVGLCAFYIIHARDLNEAIRLAADMPQAQRGHIEIRSLVNFDSRSP